MLVSYCNKEIKLNILENNWLYLLNTMISKVNIVKCPPINYSFYSTIDAQQDS